MAGGAGRARDLAPAVVPATVRDVDFRNGDWRVPLRVGEDGSFSVTPLVAEQLVAHFAEGTAVAGANRLSIDTHRFPVRYLQPTPKQVGAADGPVPEAAIVVVELRDAEGVAYVVLGFTGRPGPDFPGPAFLVLLSLDPAGPPEVTTDRDVVSITTPTGREVQRFTRSVVDGTDQGFTRRW
ncbi:hypothetical protein CryarDRAFT_2642 [Cryptosporangium arvum DSM 44712]|uniref:Uncharacterized protein n=1 Tax=Cryptosporangium arvum DSM 44712 TaxID=927661 RepID=A0A011AHM9_9ACTN|nr:hypothetical protein CryarDRAFT_2642 [Cryptosporangium arvum DSM 44712]